MFQRFHAMKDEREGGFTLIELLVVILIIAILAAIAIPVFLNQRKKGWASQSESALKNASIAMETYGTSNNGDYTGVDNETCDGTDCSAASNLAGNGFAGTVNVTLLVDIADTSGYCLEATHDLDTSIAKKYDSDVGAPEDGTC